MKNPRLSEARRAATRLICTGVCWVPSLLMAHPGHYHPDETDEFDFFRGTFFHTHGALEYVVAGMVVLNIALACLNPKPVVRLGALAMALGSLSLLPIF